LGKKRKLSGEPSRWFNHMLFSSLVDGGCVEMRVIGSTNRRSYVNDEQQFTSVVEGQPPNTAVYYGVAFRREPLKKDSFKDNILGTDLLWTEVDTEKIGWKTEDCLKAIHSLPAPLRPAACVNSGRGLHLYWRLTEVLSDVKQIEQANKVLCELMSCGDAVWDATRILRVPGSLNLKDGKTRECRIVWCYHWSRVDVHELLDAAIGGKVLWDGKWISPKRRDALIEARKQDINDNAFKYANEDKRKTTNARGLKVWDRTTYHGGPGMFGVDEAVMLFTAYSYCTLAKKSEEGMNGIVALTLKKVKEIKMRDAPGEQWDWDAEREEISKKLYRWAKKWDGGLREASEKAFNEKRKLGGRASQVHSIRGDAKRAVGRKGVHASSH
jgi:hypothetical protein